ncbi:MAG: Fur family transcriptional regulator [Candidatus Limnocylindrales bacterium]|jgi:Fur family ferric uptake transcriptional regulator
MRPSITSPQAERIVRALERAGYQATPNRHLVAELVAATGGHFTAAELLERGRRERVNIGRATVFRALELLTSLRVVERLDLPNGSHAYVLCDPDEHHHHLVCSNCGRSQDVADGELARLVDEIAKRHGYRIEAHRLELFGTCPDCAAKEPIADAGANA